MRLTKLHRHVLTATSVALGLSLIAGVATVRAQDKVQPIAIAAVKHDGPVDFEKEILPILRRSCLACHNATQKESDLILESPAAILKGGGRF